MAAELLNQKNQLARSSGKKNDLEQILNKLAQESSDTDLKIHDRTYQIQQTQQKLTDLETAEKCSSKNYEICWHGGVKDRSKGADSGSAGW